MVPFRKLRSMVPSRSFDEEQGGLLSQHPDDGILVLAIVFGVVLLIVAAVLLSGVGSAQHLPNIWGEKP